MQTTVMNASRNLAAGLAIAISLAVIPAPACTVPVARYALERWPPDLHVMRVRPSVKLQLGMLGRNHANAWVASAESSQTNDVRVIFPQTDIAWYDGPWRPGMPDTLADSPMRRRIAHDLATGTLAVCLFIDGPNAATNAAIFAQIESQLKRLQSSLTLPADPSYDPVSPSEPAPQLRSRIPLKVGFTIYRMKRDAPGEEFLVRQIDTMLSDQGQGGAAKLVFVFGRGRAIGMPPEEPFEASINDFTQFLCGACSCQVKELNPGLDLLMTANWDDAIGAYPAPAESILASGDSFRFGGQQQGPEAVQQAPAKRNTAVPTGAPVSVTGGVAPSDTDPDNPKRPVAPLPADTTGTSPDNTMRILIVLSVLVVIALAAVFIRRPRQ